MNKEKTHISSYLSHLIVLALLLLLTAASVSLTSMELGPWNTTAAMVVATLKASLVLGWFMHLRFENSLFFWLTMGVLTLIVLVIVVTFFDYSFR